MKETTFGRLLGYADVTLYTASEAANEEYKQLLDGKQFKIAVLDAKEAIRTGQPLGALQALGTDVGDFAEGPFADLFDHRLANLFELLRSEGNGRRIPCVMPQYPAN